MKFMLFALVVGVKDVVSAMEGGNVTNMLRSFILTLTYPTQVMAKNVQNVNGLEL